MPHHQDDQREEKRRASKHSIYVCYLSQDGSRVEERHACSSNDISGGGLKLTTSRALPLGCILPIEVLIENLGAVFRLKGEVKWCLELDEIPTYFAGIKLLGLTDKDYQQWQTFANRK